MDLSLGELWQAVTQHKYFPYVAGALVTWILTKVLPALGKAVSPIVRWVFRRMGQRLSAVAFERDYLEWIVTDLRRLRIAGISTAEQVHAPQLEDVFVLLELGSQVGGHVGSSHSISAEDVSTARWAGSLPTCVEASRWLLARLDVRGSGTLARTTEAVLSEWLLSPTHAERLRSLGSRQRFIHYGRSWLQLGVQRVRRLVRIEATSPELAAIEESVLRVALETRMFLSPDEGAETKRILRSEPRLAILGPPGAGKSTLLQYIALMHGRCRVRNRAFRDRRAVRRHLGARRGRVPILVSAGVLAEHLVERTDDRRNPAILDVLLYVLPPDMQSQYGDKATEYFRRQLVRGQCVVLIDGLDEVAGEPAFRALARAAQSLTLTYPKNQFIASSRAAGWRGGLGPEFRIAHVGELQQAQVRRFITSWYQATERNAEALRSRGRLGAAEERAAEREASSKARDLVLCLDASPGVARLAKTPLLLSIIALVHRGLVKLPRDRSKLYEECTKLLLEQWDTSRGVRLDDTGLTLEQKEVLCRRLGLAFHTGEGTEGSGSREKPRVEIEAIISEVLPTFGRAATEGARLLQHLMDRSGLLVERARGSVAFSHLTFQEYFAAQALLSQSQGEAESFLLEPQRLLASWWLEVLLLYAGSRSDGSSLLAGMEFQRWDLMGERLRVAALCLREMPQVRRADLRTAVLAGLLAVRSAGRLSAMSSGLEPAVGTYLTAWAAGSGWWWSAARLGARESGRASQAEFESALELVANRVEPVWGVALVSALKDVPAERFSPALWENTIPTLLGSQQAEVRGATLALLPRLVGQGGARERLIGKTLGQLPFLMREPSSAVRLGAMRFARQVFSRGIDGDDARHAESCLELGLNDSDPRVRRAAVETAAVASRAGCRTLVSSLPKLLEDRRLATHVARTLLRRGSAPAASAVLSALVSIASGSGNRRGRLVACRALRDWMATQGQSLVAVTCLQALLRENDDGVRRALGAVVRRHYPGERDALDPLVADALRSPASPDIATVLLHLLRGRPSEYPAGRELLEAVGRYVGLDGGTMNPVAIETLGHLRSNHLADFVVDLKRYATDRRDSVRASAVLALAPNVRNSRFPREAVDILTTALTDKDPAVRLAATATAARIGRALSAVPDVRDALLRLVPQNAKRSLPFPWSSGLTLAPIVALDPETGRLDFFLPRVAAAVGATQALTRICYRGDREMVSSVLLDTVKNERLAYVIRFSALGAFVETNPSPNDVFGKLADLARTSRIPSARPHFWELELGSGRLQQHWRWRLTRAVAQDLGSIWTRPGLGQAQRRVRGAQRSGAPLRLDPRHPWLRAASRSSNPVFWSGLRILLDSPQTRSLGLRLWLQVRRSGIDADFLRELSVGLAEWDGASKALAYDALRSGGAGLEWPPGIRTALLESLDDRSMSIREASWGALAACGSSNTDLAI